MSETTEPVETKATQPVKNLREATNTLRPEESSQNLVCLVSLVFLFRIPGALHSSTGLRDSDSDF